MRLIEWEVGEYGYEEQIVIPKEQKELAAAEGNVKHFLRERPLFPTQKMLKGSGNIRIQILGGWGCE